MHIKIGNKIMKIDWGGIDKIMIAERITNELCNRYCVRGYERGELNFIIRYVVEHSVPDSSDIVIGDVVVEKEYIDRYLTVWKSSDLSDPSNVLLSEYNCMNGKIMALYFTKYCYTCWKTTPHNVRWSVSTLNSKADPIYDEPSFCGLRSGNMFICQDENTHVMRSMFGTLDGVSFSKGSNPTSTIKMAHDCLVHGCLVCLKDPRIGMIEEAVGGVAGLLTIAEPQGALTVGEGICVSDRGSE